MGVSALDVHTSRDHVFGQSQKKMVQVVSLNSVFLQKHKVYVMWKYGSIIVGFNPAYPHVYSFLVALMNPNYIYAFDYRISVTLFSLFFKVYWFKNVLQVCSN